MLKRYQYLLLAGLATPVALLFFRTSEEEKILVQLEQVRTLTEIRAPEGGIEQATKARKISRLFSEKTLFDVSSAGYGSFEIPTRQELSQNILKGRAALTVLELAMQNPKVTIEGNNAQVEVEGRVLGSIRDRQGQFLDVHLIKVMLRKEQGDWYISGATHLRDLRQQPATVPSAQPD